MSPRRRLCFCLALVMGAGVCAVAAENTEAAETEITNGVPAEVQLSMLRDPFWPVGWTPPNYGRIKSKQADDDLTKWEMARKHLEITALSAKVGGGFVAIIKNVGVIEEGDPLSVTYEGLVYKWKVTSITGKGIVTERVGVFLKK